MKCGFSFTPVLNKDAFYITNAISMIYSVLNFQVSFTTKLQPPQGQFRYISTIMP